MRGLTISGGTAIEWADYTFNPWWGCTKVPGSPACVHCYAERHAHRFSVGWGDGADRRPASENTWAQPARWDRKAAKDSVRRRVFCASMGDVFEASNPGYHDPLDEPRLRLWGVIEDTPHLDWLLLTKRPENVLRMVPQSWADNYPVDHGPPDTFGPWPANVWVGVTAENQRWADTRIPLLVNIPAPVRFVSVEPMGGFVDLTPWLDRLGWVICGGESGPKAKPMHPDWPEHLRRQCNAAEVPFLFKQWGEFDMDGVRVGKAAAGRTLNGRTWDQFPEVTP